MLNIFSVTCTSLAILASLTPFVAPALDIFLPLNESRVKKQLARMEHFVDEHEYFYEINIHSTVLIVLSLITILSVARFYAYSSQYYIGFINILRLVYYLFLSIINMILSFVKLL